MPRYKITVEYDGTNFHGWQTQEKNIPTVQSAIDSALSVFKPLKNIVCAGRTDAGVHALGQVAHFDLEKFISPNKLNMALNAKLVDKKIAILNTEIVENTFNARFDAKKKIYVYKIVNRRPNIALDYMRYWQVYRKIDREKMHNYCNIFIGTHNFSAFRSAFCQSKNTIKTIDDIWFEYYDEKINIYIKSKSFLHNQIRIMVGTIIKLATNENTKIDINKALYEQNKRFVGPAAPPCGLYLKEVIYD